MEAPSQYTDGTEVETSREYTGVTLRITDMETARECTGVALRVTEMEM